MLATRSLVVATLSASFLLLVCTKSLPGNFNTLTLEERIDALNKSIIAYLDVVLGDKNIQLGTPPKHYLKGGAFKVAASDLEEFDAKLVNWMMENQSFTPTQLSELSRGNLVCGKVTCTSLPSLGQTCCPFG